MEEVAGETEVSETGTEIKILYCEHLRSWIAVIWLRIRWEQQSYYICSMPCWKNGKK